MTIDRRLAPLLLAPILAACQLQPPPSQTETTIQVVLKPAALVLTGPAEVATLTATAHDAQGNAVEIDPASLEWLVSDPSSLALSQDALDPGRATVTASVSLGSAVVSARIAGRPDTTSEPVMVVVAPVRAGTLLVLDRDVAFPPVDLPPGATPATYAPPFFDIVAGTVYFGPFSEHDLAARFEVLADGAVRYPVVVRGDPVGVGTRLLAREGAAFFGTAIDVHHVEGFNLIQLEQAALDDVFEDLAVRFDHTALVAAGLAPPVAVASGASGAGTRSALDCTAQGGLALANATAGVDIQDQPRFVVDIDTTEGRYHVVVGRSIIATAGLDVTIQATVQGSVECSIGPVASVHVPVPGPIGALLSARGDLQPKLKFEVGAGAGPRLSASVQASIHADAQVGFSCTPGGCLDLSFVNVDPEANAQLTFDPGAADVRDLRLELAASAFHELRVGVQLGGIAVRSAARWTRWVPGLRTVVDAVQDAAFQPMLVGQLGAEVHADWDGAYRVLATGASNSTLAYRGFGRLEVQNDAVDAVRRRLSLSPLELTIAGYEGTAWALYRPLVGAGISAATRDHSGSVAPGEVLTIQRGETIELTVSSALDGNPIPVFDGRIHRGELWERTGRELLETVAVATQEPFVLSLRVSDDICDGAKEQPLAVAVLGYNTMASALDAAGFLGHLSLECQEPTVSFSGPFQISTILACPEPDGATLEYVSTGTVTFDVDLGAGRADVLMAFTEVFGPSCFTHVSPNIELHRSDVIVTLVDDLLTLSVTHVDEARTYTVDVAGPVDGPLAGTVTASYYFQGQDGQGSAPITMPRVD